MMRNLSVLFLRRQNKTRRYSARTTSAASSRKKNRKRTENSHAAASRTFPGKTGEKNMGPPNKCSKWNLNATTANRAASRSFQPHFSFSGKIARQKT